MKASWTFQPWKLLLSAGDVVFQAERILLKLVFWPPSYPYISHSTLNLVKTQAWAGIYWEQARYKSNPSVNRLQLTPLELAEKGSSLAG